MKRTLAGILSLLMTLSLSAFAAKPGLPSQRELDKVVAAIPAKPTAVPQKGRRILIFDKCRGYVHNCIPLADQTFVMLGEKTGAYRADVSSDMAVFTPQNLAKYDAVLFNNTTKLTFDNHAQRKALLDFVKSGKGFIGIHAASDNFYTWPEAAGMLGGLFAGHPWHANGTWAVKIDEPDHPLDKAFHGKGFMINDEIYQIMGSYSREKQRVLLSLDMNNPANLKVKGIKRRDNDFPIAWIKPYGKGRVFYCSLGHNRHIYWNKAILQHYLDGIQYALGDLDVDASPSVQPEIQTLAEAMLGYQYGGDKTAFDRAKAIIRDTRPQEYPAIEAELIKVLNNPAASVPCKEQVCRLLRRCGSAACVSTLAGLLGDKQLSSPARFALQGIASPKVDAALMNALQQVAPRQAIGIIGTIGQRHTAQAVAVLQPIAAGADRQLAAAAITALGRIGTPAALAALLNIPHALQNPLVANAMLTTAEHIATEKDPRQAAAIYSMLYTPQQPTKIRIAALRGLTLTQKAAALPAIINALNSTSGALKKEAATFMRNLPAGENITRAIAKEMPKVDAATRAEIIDTLSQRDDPIAINAIIKAAKTDEKPCRLAALRALANINTIGSLNALLNILKENDSDLRGAATQSLMQLTIPGTDKLLVKKLPSATPAEQELLINIMTARHTPGIEDLLIASLSDKKLQKAAAEALAQNANPRQIARILQLLMTTDDPATRKNLEKAISMIVMRAHNKTVAAAPIVAALQKSDDPNQVQSLISILKRVDDPSSALAIRDKLKSPDPAIRRAAVKALSYWKTSAPADSLLELAKTEQDPAIKTLAFRGAVSLARKADTGHSLAICRSALTLAATPDDIKTALALAGTINTTNALVVITPYLTNSQVRAEAETAYASIANALISKDPPAAKAALQKVTKFKQQDLADAAGQKLKNVGAQKH